MESIHEQIAAALKSSLQGIVGDGGVTYWYTPGVVVRVPFFEETGPYGLLDSSISGPIYAIRPGEESHEEQVTQNTDAEMEVFILMLQRFTETESAFTLASVPRWTMVNRMVRDVLRKLLQDVQLLSVGGAVDNIMALPGLVDRDRWIDGWAVAELQLRIGYRYAGGVP